MHIVFNAIHTNLGNTGGCKTIVESAKTLTQMGHKVTIVAAKNRYTWDKVKTVDRVPEADACIAVSILDVANTLKHKNPIYWMRGYEHWMKPKSYIKSTIKKIRTLANSEWLADKFKCELLYSGLDLNLWQDIAIRQGDTIGYLYNTRHSKRMRDALRLKKILGDGFKFRVLGDPKELQGKELVNFYNQCDIWLSPSILEGFHNPPAEAIMCGCLPIVVNEVRGGTSDYVKHGITGLTYTNIEQAAEYVRTYINSFSAKTMIDEGQKLIRSKIGSREQNMKKLVEML